RRRPRDRQHHHQHDPACAVAGDSQALAGARGDPRGESLGGGRRVRLRSELTYAELRAMGNRFEQVDEIVGDAITVALEQRPDGQWAKVVCPKSAHESFATDRVTEPLPPKDALSGAVRLANDLKLPIVIHDPDGVW